MTQRSKAYRAVAEKIDRDALYTPLTVCGCAEHPC